MKCKSLCACRKILREFLLSVRTGRQYKARCRENRKLKVTRPSFFGGVPSYFELSGIPNFTFIVSLTNRMDNI